jgi:hypothetical protein
MSETLKAFRGVSCQENESDDDDDDDDCGDDMNR